MTVAGPPRVVRVAPAAAAAIEQAAQTAYPNEACGLLVGRAEEGGWVVSQAIPGLNVHAEPRHRFEVDPRLVFDWMRRLRGGPEQLIGHFHSHPESPAEPSATDRSSAYDRSAIWLIASVDRGRVAAIRAFQPGKAVDSSFVEFKVTVESRR